MKFKIYDLVSKKYLAVVEGKGVADREFMKLQATHPTRKLDIKMVAK